MQIRFNTSQFNYAKWPKQGVPLLLALLLLFNVFYTKSYQRPDFIRHDMLSYYGYLPAYFIHHDLSLSFAHHDSIGRYAWTVEAENGRIFKMTSGVAIMQAPFFLIADFLTQEWQLPRDGFSGLYYFFLCLGAWFYLLLGLRYLNKVLLHWVEPAVSSIVLVLLVFGTNLYYYAFHEVMMAHLYAFTLFAALLYACLKINESYKRRYLLLLGISLGLLILIRPIHLMATLIPIALLLFGNLGWWSRIKSNPRLILWVAIPALAIIFPQLLYWKTYSSQWLFYSYTNEGFFWLQPKIIAGWFSFRKGWLLYTPLMAISLVGIVFMYQTQKLWSLLIGIYTILFSYVVFSWWCWWYGGSFGSRVMIDIYPLLAIPLAYLLAYLRQKSRGIILALAFVFIYLNLFQVRQYRSTLLHWDSTSSKLYQKIWLTQRFPQHYDQLLEPPNYEAAKAGINR